MGPQETAISSSVRYKYYHCLKIPGNRPYGGRGGEYSPFIMGGGDSVKATKTLEVTGPVFHLCYCLCLGSYFGRLLPSAKYLNTFHRTILIHECEGTPPECGILLFLFPAMLKNLDVLEDPDSYSVGIISEELCGGTEKGPLLCFTKLSLISLGTLRNRVQNVTQTPYWPCQASEDCSVI